MLRINLINSIVSASVIIMIAFFNIGMGTFGEREPTKIPEPNYNFSAKVIDQCDVSSFLVSRDRRLSQVGTEVPQFPSPLITSRK